MLRKGFIVHFMIFQRANNTSRTSSAINYIIRVLNFFSIRIGSPYKDHYTNLW
uniref:Uncharacterized protein n=1 Tax=Rhizophora mucronata TaxID=61149 RepID=A0A2P2IWD5_RHIMU